MKCPGCGKENPGYVAYCGFCGGTIPDDIGDKSSSEDPLAEPAQVEPLQGSHEGFKFRFPIVALSVTSLLLLTLSLLQPWFVIHDDYIVYDQDGVRVSPGVMQNDFRLHLEYYTYSLETPEIYEKHWYAGEYWPDAWYRDNPIEELMDFMQKDVLFCLVTVWLLSLAAISNSRWIAMFFAWLSAAACLWGVAVFADSIGRAVSESGQNLQGFSLGFISGLFGEETLSIDTFYGLRLHSWSWQPGLGWYLTAIAGMLLCAINVLTWLSIFTRRAEPIGFGEADSEEGSNPDPGYLKDHGSS